MIIGKFEFTFSTEDLPLWRPVGGDDKSWKIQLPPIETLIQEIYRLRSSGEKESAESAKLYSDNVPRTKNNGR